jgi:hypothetical protein
MRSQRCWRGEAGGVRAQQRSRSRVLGVQLPAGRAREQMRLNRERAQ